MPCQPLIDEKTNVGNRIAVGAGLAPAFRDKEQKMKKILFVIVFLTPFFLVSSVVKNPDKPLKGEWDFKPRREWAVSEAGQTAFANPRQLLVSEKGTVYIYDNKHLRYFIFSSTGKYVKTFGARGEAPERVRG